MNKMLVRTENFAESTFPLTFSGVWNVSINRRQQSDAPILASFHLSIFLSTLWPLFCVPYWSCHMGEITQKIYKANWRNTTIYRRNHVTEDWFVKNVLLENFCFRFSSNFITDYNVFQIHSQFSTFFLFRRATAAAHAQIDRLWHTTNIYMNNRITEIGEKLVAKMPGNLKVSTTLTFIFHYQTGLESVEDL